jgi:hypothetical protein
LFPPCKSSEGLLLPEFNWKGQADVSIHTASLEICGATQLGVGRTFVGYVMTGCVPRQQGDTPWSDHIRPP